MLTSLQLHLASVFLKIFLRNRQAILFSLFFPLIFIGAFSFSGGERDPFLIGVADQSKSSISIEFIESLGEEDLFTVLQGRFSDLEEKLLAGDLEGLILINHKIDELASSNPSQNFIISPLTTADFFLSESLNKLTNPISTTINDLLGLDQNFNINIIDHVGSLKDGFMFAEAYERANQLTSIALSLTRLVNNLTTYDINSSQIFQIILDRMVAIYQSSQNEINICLLYTSPSPRDS